MTLPVVFTANGPSGYNLTNSLRFRSSASAYLNRTPSVAATSTTIGTISIWFKGIGQANQYLVGKSSGTIFYLYFNSSNQLVWQNGGSNTFITTQVFRDPSAWYHLVASWDTTQATSSNRQSLYLNGQQITAFGTTNNLGLNATVSWFDNDGNNRGIGTYISGGYFDGYMAEINAIDGQTLTPSSFGETSSTTGVWIPKKYTGTYGTNGFYLPFTDNSALTTSSNVGLGKDFSGNANYWTTNNISITAGSTYDSMTDVPTLTSATAANYCVWNPLKKTSGVTVSNANLTLTVGASINEGIQGTIGASSGKWYAEVTGGPDAPGVVLVTDAADYPGATANSYGYHANATKYNNGSSSSYGATFTSTDVIGIALDMDAGTVTFYKNNVSQGTAFTGLVGTFTFCGRPYGATSDWNFGQRPFAYTPPTGFVALNTFNLPTPTIGATASTTANKYMDATLYTGNGSTQTITNSGSMQPDLVWYKGRDTTFNHALFDVTRGVLQRLSSNLTTAESTTAGSLTAFNSNGFSVGNDAGANQSTNTYVAWQWKANGTGVTNTAGSITSTVSANTTSGFSVVTWVHSSTTSTIGHGLGVAPQFIILKSRTTAYNWDVGCNSIGWGNRLNLNTTDAAYSPAFWNSTAPTSTVFTYAGSGATNGDNMVAYCFTPIAGYSAFGSYTGNGSTDGTFVYTGFRPRFLMVKNASASGNGWIIIDTSRDTYNQTTLNLFPNSSGAETNSTTYSSDILSNGFKIRATDPAINGSSNTLIYMAFAESPFKYANAR